MSSAARLHLGFLDMSGELGRTFGSIGLAIDAPVVSVRAGFTGGGASANDAALAVFADRFYERYPEKRRARLYFERSIIPHAGLGSGTQSALCAATALDEVHGTGMTLEERAALMGRGRRSGIGIETFRSGGFICDGGVAAAGGLPTLLLRHPFPEEWRVLLAIPEGEPGLNGRREDAAFAALPPECADAAKEACRLVLMKLLPGLIERRLEDFGDAVERVQLIIGECFSDAQNGPFADPMARDIFAEMRRMGARGMGQSSWGPTLYCFVPATLAESAGRGLRAYFAGSAVRLRVSCVKARNTGASVMSGLVERKNDETL